MTQAGSECQSCQDFIEFMIKKGKKISKCPECGASLSTETNEIERKQFIRELEAEINKTKIISQKIISYCGRFANGPRVFNDFTNAATIA